MDRMQKEQFINDLIVSVKDKILASVDRMLEEWDGIELRQLISDTFREQTRKTC